MGLILVDSSIWIDLLHDRITVETNGLRRLSADRHRIGIGDLVLAEVLQGTRSQSAFRTARAFFDAFDHVQVCDRAVAIAAAKNYRALRALGFTPRKTIDTLIATRCILDGIPLLYSDRDFDPFVAHLGLRAALSTDTGVS